MAIRKLDKYRVIQAVSFPSIVDVVIYRDEQGRCYTLNAILDYKPRSFGEVWIMATMMDEFAPKQIIGQVEFENRHYLRIRMNGVLYRFRHGVAEVYSPYP